MEEVQEVFEVELHKGKNKLSETVKKEVNEAVSWEMEGVKREISVLFEYGNSFLHVS